MRRVARPRTSGAAALAAVCVLASCFDPPELPPLSPAPDVAAGGDRPDSTPSNRGGDGGSSDSAAPEDGGAAGAEPKPENGGAGSSTGGSPHGGSSTGGSAPHVTWLVLEGDRAPGTEKVNAALGINGSLHVYSDACAMLSWDPATRCATGKLCEPGADYENWGIAVGFDFRETASTDSPTAALVWDPRDVSALGLAWRISGSAPGLQAWVLNMDPSFSGRCSQQTCEISGPPDGVAAAPLEGELSFSNLQKDYWGGRGVRYVFDPALVYALQLKLPAVNVGAASFSFCIEALGVVR